MHSLLGYLNQINLLPCKYEEIATDSFRIEESIIIPKESYLFSN